MFVLYLSIFLLFSNVSSLTLRCDDKKECKGDTISSSDYDSVLCTGNRGCRSADITVNNVTCDGYRSCRGATIESDLVNCGGYQGCNRAIIESPELICDGERGCTCAGIEITSGGTMICDGLYSCRYLEAGACSSTSNEDDLLLRGDLECNGESSCEYSYVDIDTSSNSIECNGEYACEGATFVQEDDSNGEYDIYGNAEYALESASIYMGEDNDGVIELSGWYAGNNLDIYCGSGTECEINCYGAACPTDTMNIYCVDTSSCSIDCECDIDEYCPSIQEWDDSDFKKLSKKEKKEFIKNNKKIKNELSKKTQKTTELDDEIYKMHLKNKGKKLLNKKKTINTNLISNTLRCDSKKECYGDEILSSDYNALICSGNQACRTSDITVANVTCDGYRSCRGADIESDLLNCGGYQGCNRATIEAPELICDGERACTCADIEITSGGTMICDGLYSCRYLEAGACSSTSNEDDLLLKGDLECNGESSCEYSYIDVDTASDSIECNGEYSCYQTTIVQEDNSNGEYEIFANAEYALESAEIYFGENNDGVIELSGWYAGNNLDIYCGEDTECEIACIGAGCPSSTMNVYCVDTSSCSIDCDCEIDEFCPTVQEWDDSNFKKLSKQEKKEFIKNNRLTKKSSSSSKIAQFDNDIYKMHLKHGGKSISATTIFNSKNEQGLFWTNTHYTMLFGLCIGLVFSTLLISIFYCYKKGKDINNFAEYQPLVN